MELIRSALHNGVELTARGMPKFRRKLVLQHGKFSNRIVGHFHQGAGNACVVVVHALDGEIVIARSLSPHRGTRPHSDSATGRNSGSKQRKIQNATASRCGGQIFHQLRSKIVGHLRRGRIQSLRCPGHLNRIRHPLNFQRDWQGDRLVQLDVKPVYPGRREIRSRDRNVVCPHR